MKEVNMSKSNPFSTTLDKKVTDTMKKLCKQRGLKVSSFVEDAIVEKLEDEYDLQIYHARKNEPRISMAEAFKHLNG